MSLEQELVKQVNSLQKQVDGLVKPEVGRWMDWTPTVTQGVAVAITINYARYIINKDTITIRVRISVTGAGTGGNPIVIAGVPTAIQPANAGTFVSYEDVIGTGLVLDSGTARYQGALVAAGANDWRIQPHNTAGTGLGNAPSFALANGDAIGFQASYEKA